MKWPFNKTNYVIFGIGILTIIIGYIVIAGGTKPFELGFL